MYCTNLCYILCGFPQFEELRLCQQLVEDSVAAQTYKFIWTPPVSFFNLIYSIGYFLVVLISSTTEMLKMRPMPSSA